MTVTTPTLTLTQFLQLPNIEDSPAWEFINGQAVQKTMPTSHHSILQKRLVSTIDGANSAYEAFPELRCVLSEQSIVPDIAVIHRDAPSERLRHRIPAQNGPVVGPPD